jgi:hypothetical protein
MMRVCVIVPTTEGPAPILRLSPLAHAPRSVMRTQEDYRPLPPSGRYHAFVQTGGALADRLGQEGAGQFELRLGAAVETGRSWELPVAIAHWLHGQGHELTAEAPDLVIWATGALDNDLRLLRREYHLGTKLAMSVESLQEALRHGARICILLPEAVDLPAETDLPGVAHHRIKDLDGAVKVLARYRMSRYPDDASKTGLPQGAADRGRAGKTLLAVVAAVIAVTLLLSWRLGEWRAEPQGRRAAPSAEPVAVEALPVDEPSAPDDTAAAASFILRLVLDYAPEAGSCPAVLFGSIAPDQSDLGPEGFAYPAIQSTGLCAIGFRLPEAAPSGVDIAVPQALLRLVLPSDQRALLRLLPGETHMLRLRAGQPAAFEIDIELLSEPEESQVLSIVARP